MPQYVGPCVSASVGAAAAAAAAGASNLNQSNERHLSHSLKLQSSELEVLNSLRV